MVICLDFFLLDNFVLVIFCGSTLFKIPIFIIVSYIFSLIISLIGIPFLEIPLKVFFFRIILFIDKFLSDVNLYFFQNILLLLSFIIDTICLVVLYDLFLSMKIYDGNLYFNPEKTSIHSIV